MEAVSHQHQVTNTPHQYQSREEVPKVKKLKKRGQKQKPSQKNRKELFRLSLSLSGVDFLLNFRSTEPKTKQCVWFWNSEFSLLLVWFWSNGWERTTRRAAAAVHLIGTVSSFAPHNHSPAAHFFRDALQHLRGRGHWAGLGLQPGPDDSRLQLLLRRRRLQVFLSAAGRSHAVSGGIPAARRQKFRRRQLRIQVQAEWTGRTVDWTPFADVSGGFPRLAGTILARTGTHTICI